MGKILLTAVDSHWVYAVFRVAYSWSLRAHMTLSIKPEVHNVSQRRQRMTEPRPQVTSKQNLVNMRCVVSDISLRTDSQTETDRHAYYNKPLPYRGRDSKSKIYCFCNVNALLVIYSLFRSLHIYEWLLDTLAYRLYFCPLYIVCFFLSLGDE